MKLSVLLFVACAAIVATCGAAGAQEATPVATGESIAWSVDADGVQWESVPGAVTYALDLKATLLRVNSADACLPPVYSNVVGIEIIGSHPAADGTHAAFDPGVEHPMPPDDWMLKDATILIRALDATGAELASGGGGFVADAFCGAPVEIPGVGSGGASSASQSGSLLFATAAVLGIIGVAFLFGGAVRFHGDRAG